MCKTWLTLFEEEYQIWLEKLLNKNPYVLKCRNKIMKLFRKWFVE